MQSLNKNLKLINVNTFEIIFILCLLFIVFSLSYIAINPEDFRSIKDIRNSERKVELLLLSNTLAQYVIDGNSLEINDVLIPNCMEGKVMIGKAKNNLDLNKILVPNFINAIPVDPLNGSNENTGYEFCFETNNNFSIYAVNPENQGIIKITR